MSDIRSRHLAVIGLGYVGLSLATAFGRVLPTLGYDTDVHRVQDLRNGRDRNGEVSPDALAAPHLSFTDQPEDLKWTDIFLVAVPTTIDEAKRPDLTHLKQASCLVGQALKARTDQPGGHSNGVGPIVVYESTVYPGCTEEVCIPLLETESGLKAGLDFRVGYSPERINPGDPYHSLDKVVKVVSAQDHQTLEVLATIYGLVVEAGVYRAPDIRTAEAAKAIENVQRDLNIALMNELAMLFRRMGINTREVLKAAETKWNFLPFEPGLVGGHCIPVDPHYLSYKAEELGYQPQVIQAGRRINDQMGVYIAQELLKLLRQAGKPLQEASILVLGVTFKENVRDVRNTLVVDLVRTLEHEGAEVRVFDPLVELADLKFMGLNPVPDPFGAAYEEASGNGSSQYDAVVIAVAHRVFRDTPPDRFLGLLKSDSGPGVLIDVKGILPWSEGQHARVIYWSL